MDTRMIRRDLWERGAAARLSGFSVAQCVETLHHERHDRDDFAAFKSGWMAMDQFMLLSRMTGTLTATRVAPD